MRIYTYSNQYVMSNIIDIMQHKYYKRYVIGAFGYGFIRQFNSKPEHDNTDYLFLNRFILSSLNGIVYMMPIFGLGPLYRTMARAEILISGKDPKDYKRYYQEYNYDCNYNALF